QRRRSRLRICLAYAPRPPRWAHHRRLLCRGQWRPVRNRSSRTRHGGGNHRHELRRAQQVFPLGKRPPAALYRGHCPLTRGAAPHHPPYARAPPTGVLPPDCLKTGSLPRPPTVTNPSRNKSVAPTGGTPRAEREQLLTAPFYILFLLPADDVLIDLLTDSGTG